MPYRLQEIYCAQVNGNIHIAGGFTIENDTFTHSRYHLVYNPGTDQWTEQAPLPEPRHHPQLVSSGKELYALGGFRVQSEQAVWNMQSQTWRYNPETNQWEERRSAPTPHGETVSALLNNRIHLVGGRRPSGNSNATYNDHADSSQHLLYHPDTDTWSEAAAASIARNSAAGAVINGLWYVTGGRQVNGQNVADLDIYDPAEDRWRKGKPMPQAQGGLGAAALNGKLYAFGGEYFSNGGGVYKACWVYDPEKDHWEAGPDMKTPRHGLAGIAVAGKVFALGGAQKRGGEQTSPTVEYLIP